MPPSDDMIPGNRTVTVGLNDVLRVVANRVVAVDGNDSAAVKGTLVLKVHKEASVTAKTLLIEADDDLELRVGAASLVMKKDGTIQLRGRDISIHGMGKVDVKSSGDVNLHGRKINQN